MPSHTLRGPTRGWYAYQKLLSFNSFIQLTKEFELYFLENVHLKSSTMMLLRLRQGEEKTFLDFNTQFTNEIRHVDNAHISFMIQSFIMGLRPSCLFWSLVERILVMIPEVLQRANQYITTNIIVLDKCGEPHKRPR